MIKCQKCRIAMMVNSKISAHFTLSANFNEYLVKYGNYELIGGQIHCLFTWFVFFVCLQN